MRVLNRRHVHDLTLALALFSAGQSTRVWAAVGLTLFALGLALHVWSKCVLVRNVQLCTEGPYALCRHPFHLSNILFDLGICTMTGNVWLLVLYPILFWAAYRPTIQSEESSLAAIYGEAHAKYRATTPLILPAVTHLWTRGRGEVCWDHLVTERIMSRVARHLSFPLLILLAARLWRHEGEPASPVNLTLAAAAVALNVLSIVLYSTVERRGAKE